MGDDVPDALKYHYDQTHEHLHHRDTVETIEPRQMESELKGVTWKQKGTTDQRRRVQLLDLQQPLLKSFGERQSQWSQLLHQLPLLQRHLLLR